MSAQQNIHIGTYQGEYAPSIRLIEEAFEIPQLDKTRRIWALLPHDYDHTNKHYPVIYLQDAQNLFDSHAPFGTWGIDRHMAEMSRGGHDFIVIAIDHAGRERINEYSPYFHREFGKGQGKLYAKFIINTLKPYVDREFRTFADRRYNGIGGSSMGALISAYIGIVHPAHFGNLMIFSPSFWYSDEIYFDAFNYQYTLPTKIYLYAGERESRFMTQHVNRFRSAIESHPHDNPLTRFKIQINPNGEHSERYWGESFSDAVKWLFF
jgi:predicted alpha/beta superfamily hydrolase